MIRGFAYRALLLSLMACASSEPVVLPIDSMAAKSFAERVKKRFANYADTSGYQYPKPPSLYVRGNEGEPVILFPVEKGSSEDVIVYTFDRSDSCTLFSGVLVNEMYLIPVQAILIPMGRYFLKLGETTVTFDRP